MSKKNIIILSVLLLVYVLALIVFHATYNYVTYFEFEAPIIIRYSCIYMIIGLILFGAFNWQKWNTQLSDMSLKKLTLIVACVSGLKFLLNICHSVFNDYFYFGHNSFVVIISWLTVSIFFFTLHKNMH